MNPYIKQHFENIEIQLLESPVVNSYTFIRQEIAPTDGKIRIKADLFDGGIVEIFEYVSESAGAVIVKKYSFHWQDQQGILQRRWDNAPHHPGLPGAPHHVHLSDQIVQGMEFPPSVFEVLTFIEGQSLPPMMSK